MRAWAFLLAALLAAGCVSLDLRPTAKVSPTPSSPLPASPLPTPAAPAGTLRVQYVDVGQGDGTIWQLPDGSVVVYDCGPAAPSAEENPMVQALRALGVPRDGAIHALVASHGHLDHVGGCDEVFAEHRVAHVYESWYEGADAPQSYARFRDAARAEGAVIHAMRDVAALDGEIVHRAGDAMPLPGAASAQILGPLAFPPSSWDDIAHASLVVRLALGDVTFCFQGDVELRDERELAEAYPDLRCTVLLMGHHGSQYASGAGWLAHVKPQVAVVSFGANSYGHPTAEALCRVQASGATVYATHRNGTVEVTTNGVDVTVRGIAETKDYCATGASYW